MRNILSSCSSHKYQSECHNADQRLSEPDVEPDEKHRGVRVRARAGAGSEWW